MVERLNQESDLLLLAGGISKIFDKAVFGCAALGKADHYMDVWGIDDGRITQRLIDCGPGFTLAPWQSGEPVLIGGKVSTNRVQPQHGQAGGVECGSNLDSVVFIRPVAFNHFKARRIRRMDCFN